jgi:hypothetical protein
LIARGVNTQCTRRATVGQGPLTLLNKFEVLFSWSRITLPKITAHNLTRFSNVPHHGHVALVLIVGPMSVGLIRHNFGGINIERHLLASLQCGLQHGLVDCFPREWEKKQERKNRREKTGEKKQKKTGHT